MIVSNINKGNKALEFIDKRIDDEKYRGNRSSQHNRYTMVQVIKILELLNKYSPEKELMVIRTADIKKRPENTPDEFIYAEFCNEAKQIAGIGTQDAMRKNLFVDMHRMGLIERYNIKKELIDPYSAHSVKYVSITDQGLKLINADNILNKYFIFSKGIDKLLGGYIDVLLEIFRNENFDIKNISMDEYMFFISAIGTTGSFNISTDEAVSLVKEYRNLTPVQKRSVVEKLKDKLKPKNYIGNKNKKRDFHNWRNRVQQIYHLLNQTVYFEVSGEQLVLKQGENSLKQEMNRLNRSLSQKFEYFSQHNIKKISGFELHHVIPLAWSENIHHFKMLDKWENMVYIDAFSHAKITQNNNKNVILDTHNDDISLTDHSNNQVYLMYQKNISYKPNNKETMKQYNNELLNVLK